MKRLFAGLLFLSMPFVMTASANSGPSYWQGYPSSELLSVEGNSPIEVQAEELLFDFSGLKNRDYSPQCNVYANYSMYNSSDQVETVQMAFPFIGDFNSLDSEAIRVYADGMRVPYEIYLGDKASSGFNTSVREEDVSNDFRDILGTIHRAYYQSDKFDAEDTAKLYNIEVEPTSDQQVFITVSFNLDNEKTQILAEGFNGGERLSDELILSELCEKKESYKLLVIGEDINLEINGYLNSNREEKTELYDYKVTEETVTISSYLVSRYLYDRLPDKRIPNLSDTQIYNMYAAELDQQFTNNQGYCDFNELLQLQMEKRFIVLVYDVAFQPTETKELKVNYIATGTMDKRKTEFPLYTYHYLLNPAKNWNGFHDLSIKIITPLEAPYLVRSNIELAKEDEYVYTAFLEELPAMDFSFTIYAKEKAKILDSMDRFVMRLADLKGLLVIHFLGAFVNIIIFISILKRKRKVG